MFSILSRRPIWRLLFSGCSNALKCHPLLCVYNKFKEGSSALHVVSAWKGHHTRTEYRARLARPGTLEPMDTRVLLVLHTSGKASISFGPQSVTEFVYGKLHRELLLTEIMKGGSTKCDCAMNDDIEVSTTGLWPSAPLPDAADGVTSSENNQD
jgi:hypothetical protein